MAGQFIDLTGHKFGRLTVVKFSGMDNGRSMWECLCDCGNNKIALSSSLKRRTGGSIRSCGCLRTENGKRTIEINRDSTTHGMSQTSEYGSWVCMKKRCYNIKHKSYPNYGGIGVTVCDRWLNSFENFYEDMGDKPSPNHSLDKDIKAKALGIKPLIYSPEMCCWATQEEQQNSKRNNHIVEYNGLFLTVAQWSTKLGIKRGTIDARLNRHNWSIERALTA